MERVEKRKGKGLLIAIFMLLFQSLIYFLTKLVQEKAFVLNSSLEDKIPFISWFVYFYIIWYPMLLIIPICIYNKKKDVFYRYFSVYIISVLICGIIFVLFPTTLTRPVIKGTDITSFLVNKVYELDTPATNCLPSIHCLVSILFMYGIRKLRINNVWKAIVYVLSICIILSTFFIKQHVILDLLAAIAVIAIAITITNAFGIWKKMYKLFERQEYKEI